MAETYRIRFKVGQFEFEVESTDKQYVENKLKEHLAKAKASEFKEASPDAVASAPNQKPMSLQEFVNRIAPSVDTEYVLAVAFYCERMELMPALESGDIVRRLHNIKYKHTNLYHAISRAKRNGFLMAGTVNGTFVATRTGEEWIRARLTENKGVPA